MKFVALHPEHEVRFAAFLKRLKENGDEAFFSPHPFTDAEAKRLCSYKGKDYYCIVLEADRVAGYGILRGWDEGFEKPSLGIAVDPTARRKGVSKHLMTHLHDVARSRGAKVMRLRVRNDNRHAIRLYEEFGYDLEPDEEKGFLVGFAKL